MSIVRVGLAETEKFSDGYDLIFGKKDEKPAAAEQPKAGESRPSDQPTEPKAE